MQRVWTSNTLLKQNLICTDVAANGQQKQNKTKTKKHKKKTRHNIHTWNSHNTLTNTMNTHWALLQRKHHGKILKSLAPVRITRNASNLRCDISLIKCHRMLKICLIVGKKMLLKKPKTQMMKCIYIYCKNRLCNFFRVSVGLTLKTVFMVEAMLSILNLTVNIMVIIFYDNDTVISR